MGVPPECAAALLACAKSTIHFLARQLHRKPAFRCSDIEDLQQELSTRLVAKAHLYDPSRGAMSTFADRVLKSAAAMMLRESRRLKRSPGAQNASLDAEVCDQDGRAVRLADMVTADDQHRRLGGTSDDPIQHLVTKEAVDRAIAALPADSARIINAYRDTGTVTRAAELCKVSRRRVYEAISELAERLGDS
jgi:RNA polymerase sigma factor (sigma-70 family)